MKTTRTLIAALGAVALLSFAGSATAQYRATGDDGITASPKLREVINARAAAPSAAVNAKHGCANCKDEYVTRTDSTARGAVKPTVLIAKHLCGSCATAVSTTGTGKASRDVTTHTCSMAGGTCCGAPKS